MSDLKLNALLFEIKMTGVRKPWQIYPLLTAINEMHMSFMQYVLDI